MIDMTYDLYNNDNPHSLPNPPGSSHLQNKMVSHIYFYGDL